MRECRKHRLLNELAKFYHVTGRVEAKDTTLPRYLILFHLFGRRIKQFRCRQQNFLIINKGLADGVTPDLGVISNQGIVGIVSNVTEHYAVVIRYLTQNNG
jgi:cell shape-determining protein MreC